MDSSLLPTKHPDLFSNSVWFPNSRLHQTSLDQSNWMFFLEHFRCLSEFPVLWVFSTPRACLPNLVQHQGPPRHFELLATLHWLMSGSAFLRISVSGSLEKPMNKFYPSCKFETWMKSFQPHNSWAWWHPMKQQQKWGQAKAKRCQRSGLKRRKMKGQSAQRPAPGRWHLAKMCKATQKHQKLSKICRYLSIMSSFCYLFDLILTC